MIRFVVLETPHVAIGAAIASKIPNPAISLPLSLASHFILERIPHWNPHLNTEKKKFGKITAKSTKIIVIDSLIALSLGSFIAYRSYPDMRKVVVILLSCLFSILPDLIEAPYFFLNKDSQFVRKWVKFQKSIQVDTNPFWGLTTQAITLTTALWWIFT